MTVDLNQRHVLVVEDDARISALLRDYLSAEGYMPTCLVDGRDVPRLLRKQSFCAVLLDVSLPGNDGYTLCQQIRVVSAIPILFLTAKIEDADRLRGFDVGADDYVCKPFSPREVMARVHALVRRAEGKVGPAGELPYKLDEAGQQFIWKGARLNLTPLEYRLLSLMVSRPGRVFTRAELLDSLHHLFKDVSDRAIDSHIKNIRRKIAAADPGTACITSVYGVGYRFELEPSGERSTTVTS
jgi:two-component system response regulator BaeR